MTTSVPVMVSTNAPKTTVTVTVGSAAWITTVTVPAIIADTGMRSLNPSKHSQESLRKETRFGTVIKTLSVLFVSEEPGLGENYPTQTEMAIIYQSAAWILAGLLLAIIIFLIVALLVNKKKKWVQMSCYSAPKKVRSYL